MPLSSGNVSKMGGSDDHVSHFQETCVSLLTLAFVNGKLDLRKSAESQSTSEHSKEKFPLEMASHAGKCFCEAVLVIFSPFLKLGSFKSLIFLRNYMLIKKTKMSLTILILIYNPETFWYGVTWKMKIKSRTIQTKCIQSVFCFEQEVLN